MKTTILFAATLGLLVSCSDRSSGEIFEGTSATQTNALSRKNTTSTHEIKYTDPTQKEKSEKKNSINSTTHKNTKPRAPKAAINPGEFIPIQH